MAGEVAGAQIAISGDTTAIEAAASLSVKEMEKATKAAQKAADKAAKETERAAKKAAKAAEKAAKEAAKAWQDQVGGLEETTKKLLEQVGGTVGALGNLAVEGTKALGKMVGLTDEAALAFGAVGIGAAVAAITVGGFALGLLSVANAAVEAKKRLDAQNVAVNSQQAEAIDAYAAASGNLAQELDQAGIAAGSGIAEDLGAVKRALAEGLEFLRPYTENVIGLTDAMRLIPVVGTLVSGATEAMLEPFKETNRQQVALTESSNDYVKILEGEGKAIQENGVRLKAEIATQTALIALLDDITENRRRNNEERAIELTLSRAAAAAFQAESAQRGRELEFFEAQHNAEEERLADISERRAQESSASASATSEREAYLAYYKSSQEAQRAEDEETTDKFKAGVEAAVSSGLSLLSEYAAAIGGLQQAMLDDAVTYASRQVRATQRQYDKEIAAAEEKFNSDGELTSAEQDMLDELAQRKKSAVEAERQQQRGAVMEAFRGSQQWARAQVVLQGAALIASLAAQLAGVLGPGAIPAAVALGGPLIATQLALVNRQKAPEFPMGRSPDHPMTAALQRDEAVLSRRGVERAGGPDAIDRLNRGEYPGGSESVVRVEVDLAPRVRRMKFTTDRRVGKRDHRR